jgi:A/G-specific adenine glycosylase
VSIPIDSNEGKKYFSDLAQELLSISDPATHNQAIMEIGAIQCLPVNPLCDSCPLNAICLSLSQGVISDRPVKSKKTKTRDRFFHFLIFKNKEQVIIEKRLGKDIWQHLYQFPLVEIDSDRSLTNLDFSEFGVVPFDFSENIKHVLSHQKINARFYYFDSFPVSISDNYLIIDKKNIQDYPMPRLMDRFLENEID